MKWRSVSVQIRFGAVLLHYQFLWSPSHMWITHTWKYAENIEAIVTPNEYFNVKPVQRYSVEHRTLDVSSCCLIIRCAIRFETNLATGGILLQDRWKNFNSNTLLYLRTHVCAQINIFDLLHFERERSWILNLWCKISAVCRHLSESNFNYYF